MAVFAVVLLLLLLLLDEVVYMYKCKRLRNFLLRLICVCSLELRGTPKCRLFVVLCVSASIHPVSHSQIWLTAAVWCFTQFSHCCRSSNGARRLGRRINVAGTAHHIQLRDRIDQNSCGYLEPSELLLKMAAAEAAAAAAAVAADDAAAAVS